MKLVELSQKTAAKYGGRTGNSEAALDPATISVFLNMIMQVFQMFKDCRQTPAQANQEMKSPGVFKRIKLRQLVRDEIGNREFRKHGDDIMEALYEQGKELDVKDVEELYKEVD